VSRVPIRLPGRSGGEDTFAEHCQIYGMTPQREYVFHPGRRWRFDFAWPEEKIAVEIEGGTFQNGRHQRPLGFENDCRKYNAAVLDGWKVLRFTTRMVTSGAAINDVLSLLL